jgi:hypothetical protein
MSKNSERLMLDFGPCLLSQCDLSDLFTHPRELAGIQLKEYIKV